MALGVAMGPAAERSSGADTMTCNDCREILTPDGRRVLLCDRHGENGATWRAQAEALAEAARPFAERDAMDCGEFVARMECLRAALARLPADALAERRALETDAARYRFLRNEAVLRSEYGVWDGQGYWTGVPLDERLDVARREGGA